MRLTVVVIALLSFSGLAMQAQADGCRLPVRPVVVQQKAVKQVIQPAVVAPIVTNFVATQVPVYSTGYNAQGDTAQALRELIAEVRGIKEALNGGKPAEQPTETTTQARVEALMAQFCVKCHKPDVAATKGGGHTLVAANGKIADGVDIADLWDEVDSGRMPKGGPALSDDDVGTFKALLKEGLRNRKESKGDSK